MESDCHFPSENIKQESDCEVLKVKEEVIDGDNTDMSPVVKKTRTGDLTHSLPDEDNFLYCEECQLKCEGSCPKHGPLNDNTEGHTVKEEVNDEENKNMPTVIKKASTHSTSLCFSKEDSFLYCEKCQMKYEGDCPEHGPLIYVDNAEDRQGEGYSKDSMARVQKAKKLDRQVIGQKKIEQPGSCEEYEGTHYCVQGYLPITKVEYMQVVPCDSYLEFDNDSLSEHKSKNVNKSVIKGGTASVTNRSRHSKTKLKITEGKKGEYSLSHQEKTSKMCESNTAFSAVEENTEICLTDPSSVLPSNVQMKTHKGIHKLEKHYKCDVCCAAFARSDQLNTHKKLHVGEKPYKCNICGLSFTYFSHLKIHQRIHTGEKPYKCDICGTAFTQSGQLNTHKKIHTGEKPHKCSICGVGFARPSQLKTHHRTHTGEKPHKCDVCGVGFAQRGQLKIHTRTHTGEKPYKCDICGVGFTHSGHLKIHIRTHTGEKPYKCDVCGVGFTHSGHLKTHYRIHTGEKRFKCDVCGVAFIHASQLKTHKRTHTGENVYI